MTGNVTDLLQAWIQGVLLMVKISIFLFFFFLVKKKRYTFYTINIEISNNECMQWYFKNSNNNN